MVGYNTVSVSWHFRSIFIRKLLTGKGTVRAGEGTVRAGEVIKKKL